MEGREGGLLERRDHVGFPILGDVCTTGGGGGSAAPWRAREIRLVFTQL